jgi:hypothetical protein
VRIKVTGYDNKGEILRYRVDFGDGSQVVEQENDEFEHRYEAAGTYVVRAQVKDSHGEWRESDKGGCETSIRVLTKALEKQPETGAGLLAWLLIGGSGASGVGLLGIRRIMS